MSSTGTTSLGHSPWVCPGKILPVSACSSYPARPIYNITFPIRREPNLSKFPFQPRTTESHNRDKGLLVCQISPWTTAPIASSVPPTQSSRLSRGHTTSGEVWLCLSFRVVEVRGLTWSLSRTSRSFNMFRRSPLLGAAVVYGASRAGARRGMQREAERQQAMEWEAQARAADRESRRREEERRRAEELERHKEQVKREIQEEEEKKRLRAQADQQQQNQQPPPVYIQPPQQYAQQPGMGPPTGQAGVDTVFCTRCGNMCRVGDRFCSGCGNQLPPPGNMA